MERLKPRAQTGEGQVRFICQLFPCERDVGDTMAGVAREDADLVLRLEHTSDEV
jgi:hypothetical protein